MDAVTAITMMPPTAAAPPGGAEAVGPESEAFEAVLRASGPGGKTSQDGSGRPAAPAGPPPQTGEDTPSPDSEPLEIPPDPAPTETPPAGAAELVPHAAVEDPAAAPPPAASEARADGSSVAPEPGMETEIEAVPEGDGEAAAPEAAAEEATETVKTATPEEPGPARATAEAVTDASAPRSDADGSLAAVDRPVASPAAEADAVRPPPRPEAPPPPPNPVTTESIVFPLRVLAKEGGGEARILLSPPELGRVDVTVVVEDGTVRARLEPERADVGQMLVRHVPELRESLNALGLGVEEVTVGSGESREHDGAGSRAEDPSHGASPGTEGDLGEVVEPGWTVREYIGPDGVDVLA